MKNNCDIVKNTCGTSTYAECVNYEGKVNESSELKTHCALSIEETTQDIYNQLEEIDLSGLGETCLSYVTTSKGKTVVKNVLLKYEEEICNLRQKVLELENRQICDFPISQCITDLSCLELPCDRTIITVADWMNAITTKICETT